MRTKLKDVVDGYVLERRFNIGEKLEDVRVERRPYQFLYKEGDDYIFMNQETFEQVPIAHDLIEGVDFLKEEMIVEVVSDASTETILFAELPVKGSVEGYLDSGPEGGALPYNSYNSATAEKWGNLPVSFFIKPGGNFQMEYLRRFIRRSCKKQC